MVLRTRTSRDEFLATTEAYHPDWRAFIDGQPQEVVVTNGYFRGIFVPAGDHTVRFVYRPKYFQAGALVSLTTCLLPVLSWLPLGRKT